MTRDFGPPLLAAACALAVSAAGAAEPEWRMVRSKDGIETFENTRADNGYREFKGVATLDASIVETVGAIKDIPGSVDWLPGCRRSEEVRRLSSTEVLVYIISNAPWPIRDREVVWKRNYLVETEDYFLMRFHATDVPYDGEPGLVRMTRARGAWEVRTTGPSTVEVSFSYVGDGGGNVPRSLVNGTTRKLPHKVLVALDRRIRSLRGAPEATD
jgi:hypothetical protein